MHFSYNLWILFIMRNNVKILTIETVLLIYWVNNRRDIRPERYPEVGEAPHTRQFLENGNVATRPAGSAVLDPGQMLFASVYSRTLHRRSPSPNSLRRRFFLDARRWMHPDRSWTSFDSHGRREKSIFFIGENAFRCKGALLRTSNCRNGRLH